DGVPARKLLAVHGHAARAARSPEAVGGAARAVEALAMTDFWRDRPTLVTGATGLVGSCLVKRLVAQRADVVCLVRDSVPRSEFWRAGVADSVTVGHRDVRAQVVLERALGEYEIDTVIHLAAQTIVPIANRNPVSTFESNVGGTWALLEACRRGPALRP